MGKKSALADLSDQEILQKAGHLGPGIIGQELYDRAVEIRARTVDGRLGPGIVGKAAGAVEVDITPWDDVPRNQCMKIARENNLAVKPNWTHDKLAEALVRADVKVPAAEGAE